MENCNIVNDLLPLYADDLLSDQSTMFVTWIPGTHNYEGVSTPMDS